MIAEKYLARHFLSAQQALGQGEIDSVYWLPGSVPGSGNPADGLTRESSDTAPLFRILGSGRFSPASLWPLKGVPWWGGNGRV